MDKTVQEHISQLEQRIRRLKEELTEQIHTQAEHNCIQAEIHVAELVLSHYRAAIQLESGLK